jgi:type II secretory pathway predicted ATPase ExeA
VDRPQFGMTRRPFRPAVDTGSYFPSATHEAARLALAAAFARRDPVVLLDGEPGTGKSLVARRWLEGLPPEVPRVVLPHAPAASAADLLQAILFDLSQSYQGLGEQELRLAVTELLLAAVGTGYPTVLLIDEAQHLAPAAVEEVRLLGNVETADGAALFALLVAQPALREVLERDRPFAQRVAAWCRVEPLSADESREYIRHQVRAAGGDPERVFDEEAVSLLAGACGGIPRVLNRAAGLAVELAADAGAERIDVEAALEALARLGREAEPGEPVLIPHPARPTEPAPPARSGAPGPGPPPDTHQPAARRTPKQKAARKRSA